ncbi:MAG: helix-hairpin-helix domain-containing protein [Chitinophagaceae bacterium]
MWKKFVKDYLSFTKKDRAGIMVLVTLILFVIVLPRFWPAKKAMPASKEEIEKMQLLAAALPAADQQENIPNHTFPDRRTEPKEKAVLFSFDPNTLDVAGWKRLGIRDRTVATIQNYLAKGGQFRKAQDIGKIYGLFKDDYERLLPYVQIKNTPAIEKKVYEERKTYPFPDKPVYPAKRAPAVIEINAADTTALIALPGIGSKLAARIISFREKLGGFYAVQQVAETYGLADSTFNKIKTLLQCNPAAVGRININTADATILKQHPYIRWNLANAIVQYRNQHGSFKSVDDLQLIEIVTPEIWEKLKPYIVIE